MTDAPTGVPPYRVYRGIFPRDVSHEAVVNFLRALGALPPPRLFQVTHHVVFETVGDASGIYHYLVVPDWVVVDVPTLLRTHIPGTNLQEVGPAGDPIATTNWSRISELAMSTGSVPLRVKSPRGTTSTILAPFSAVPTGNVVALQWTLTTDRSRADAADHAHREAKFSDTSFIAVGRIAGHGPEAGKLIQRVFGSLSTTHATGIHFQLQFGRQHKMAERLRQRRAPRIFPCRLNAGELSAIIGIPFGVPHLAGLPQGRAIQLPPDPSIPSAGRRIFESNFPGAERPLALDPVDRCAHMFIIGPTSVGKSTLLENLIMADIYGGSGLAYIDPKGDSVERILAAVPEERLNDVIVFDVTDLKMPVGLNPMAGERADRTAGRLMQVFDKLFDLTTNTPRALDVMRNTIMTLAGAGFTLVDIPLAIDPAPAGQAFRRQLGLGQTNDELASFWQWMNDLKSREQSDVAATIMRRIRQFHIYDELRLAFGQTQPRLDLRTAIAQKKIILVPLNRGELHEEASIVGTLFLDQLWNAVRVGKLAEEFYLYVDEFRDVMNLAVSFGDMLAQARGYRLPITIATQNLSRMSRDLIGDVMSNARTKVVFQLGHDDAQNLARELGPDVTPGDLMALGPREVVGRFHIGGHVTRPVTGSTYPPVQAQRYAEDVRALSRRAYGRPAEEVDAEIKARRRSFQQPVSRALQSVADGHPQEAAPKQSLPEEEVIGWDPLGDDW